jgi:hypothetical protein
MPRNISEMRDIRIDNGLLFSLVNAASIVTVIRLDDKGVRVQVPKWGNIFLPSMSFRPGLELIRPPLNGF